VSGLPIEGRVALVTGANRGLGREFARALVARGARTVYGAARNPATVTDPGVTPVTLDLTDPTSVARVAREHDDVDLLVNNAGLVRGGPVSNGSTGTVPDADALAAGLELARAEVEANYLGLLATTRAFAPVLATNGGGAMLNMLSVASFRAIPPLATYAATKAAAWSLTHATRIELRAQGTLVVGVHVGFVDTDATAGIDAPKLAPADVVARALDGLEAGEEEVLVDEISRASKSGLSRDLELLYPEVQAAWDGRG